MKAQHVLHKFVYLPNETKHSMISLTMVNNKKILYMAGTCAFFFAFHTSASLVTQ